MSERKRNVPKLRFPGFTEDWEQRKLGEVVERVSCTSEDSEIPQVEYEDIISGEGRLNKDITKKLSNKKGILFRKGDVLYGKLRPYLKNWLLPDFSGKAVGDFWVLRSEKVQSSFLYNLIQSNRFELASNQSTGTKMPRADWNLVANTEFPVPVSIEEQISIGNIFKLLNNSITLHQRKLENLKLKKKALLQKLFPKNGEQFPELRFPGFTDAWEQRKLSDFTERVVRKNGEESDRPLTISAQDGLVDQREYFNRQVASKDMSNYYLIKNGEFAYNKSYSEGYPFGAIKRLDYYESGALSTLYIVFKLIDANVLSVFIVAYYMTHLWYGEISKRASEGARNHGLLNISPADFFQSEMLIPTNVNEQRLIGKFFEDFENLITLHQRKLEHLQLQKKSLLQLMFV